MRHKQFIEFSEKQYPPLWLVRIPLIGIGIMLCIFCILQIGFNKSIGNNPMSNVELAILTIFFILFSLLFSSCNLQTNINKDGVYIKYFPFHLKYKYYSWESIERSQIIRYNPLKEFGGWGIKTSIFRFQNFRIKKSKNICYTISGNKGLELTMKDGKRVVIGTQKPNDLEEALVKLKKKKE